MDKRKHYWVMIVILGSLIMGCNSKNSPNTTNIDSSLYLLTSEPAGAISVQELKDVSPKNEDDIVVFGRIGGIQPWIKGLSVFTLVDSALTPCNERPDDTCPPPWDYCCEADLAANQTLIKVVDKQGMPLELGAQELLDVKELQTVVVQGKVQRDTAGNLSVLASGVFIRR